MDEQKETPEETKASDSEDPQSHSHAPTEGVGKVGEGANSPERPEPSEQDEKSRDRPRFLGLLHDIRVAALDVIILILVIVCFGAIAKSMFQQSVVLEAVSVSKRVDEQFLSTSAVSGRLADEVQKVQTQSTKATSRKRLLEPEWRQPDIQVPGASLSLHAVVNFLKGELGRSDNHIAGELNFGSGGKLRLTVRNMDSSRVWTSGYYEPADADALFEEGGREIVRLIDPASLASYWFQKEIKTNDFKQTRKVIAYSLANDYERSRSRVYNIWGNLLASNGRYTDAITNYKKGLEGTHGFAELHSNLADSYASIGKFDEAEKEYKIAVSADQTLDNAYQGLANVSAARGQYDEAKRWLNAGLKNIKDAPWLHESLADLYFMFGDQTLAKEHYSKAIEIAKLQTDELEQGGGYTDAPISQADMYNAWGLADLGEHDVDGSINLFGKALEIYPNSVDTLNNLAVAALFVGDLKVAFDSVRLALKINANNSVTLKLMGDLLSYVHQFEASKTYYMKALETNSLLPDAHKELASMMLNGNLDSGTSMSGAEEHIRQARQINPAWPRALATRGQLLYAKGDFEGGNQIFQNAVQQSPADAALLQNWGDQLLSVGDMTAAADKYERALKLDPTLLFASTGWGVALMSLGNLEAAEDKFHAALKGNAFAIDCLSTWGNLLIQRGEFEAGSQKYEDAVKLDPTDPWILVNWGDALAAVGKVDDAISNYQAALTVRPNYQWAYKGWGDRLVDKEDYAGAIGKYWRAIDVSPNLAAAYVGWGVALARAGDFQGGVGKFETALSINPDLADADAAWGDILFRQGNASEAIAKYKDAIRLNPRSASFYHDLGSQQKKRGMLLEAEGNLRQAAKLAPNCSICYYDLALFLSDKHDDSGAIESYERSLRIAPATDNAVDTLLHLGEAQFRIGDYVRGNAAFQQAIQRDSKNAGFYNLWGVAQFKSGLYHDAAASFLRAIDADNQVAIYYSNLGHAYFAEENYVGARDQYESSLRIDPNLQEARTGLQDAIANIIAP